jgi:hypothetical protein
LEPFHGHVTILNGSWEPVLWSQAIVRRNYHSLEVQGKLKAVILAVRPSTGANAKATTMDVVEDRELCGRGGSWFVETEVEIMRGVKESIFPDNRTIIMDRNFEAWFRRTPD